MCNENSRNSSRFITTFTNCVSGDLLQLTWQSDGLQCEWYRDQIPLETLHISEIKYAVLLYTLYVITSQNRKAHLKNRLVIFDTKINVHISIIFICQLASMQSFEELLFKMQDQEETCMQFFFFFFFLMPLSTIYQLYHGSQSLLVEETRVPRQNHRSVASY